VDRQSYRVNCSTQGYIYDVLLKLGKVCVEFRNGARRCAPYENARLPSGRGNVALQKNQQVEVLMVVAPDMWNVPGWHQGIFLGELDGVCAVKVAGQVKLVRSTDVKEPGQGKEITEDTFAMAEIQVTEELTRL